MVLIQLGSVSVKLVGLVINVQKVGATYYFSQHNQLNLNYSYLFNNQDRFCNANGAVEMHLITNDSVELSPNRVNLNCCFQC